MSVCVIVITYSVANIVYGFNYKTWSYGAGSLVLPAYISRPIKHINYNLYKNKWVKVTKKMNLIPFCLSLKDVM